MIPAFTSRRGKERPAAVGTHRETLRGPLDVKPMAANLFCRVLRGLGYFCALSFHRVLPGMSCSRKRAISSHALSRCSQKPLTSAM
jgi:hypothetical protein